MALRDWWDMIYSVIKTAEPVDILDILVLSYVVYLAMKLVRETRAGQLIKGIFLILIVYMIAVWIQMKAISYLLSETLNIGLIALIILFQPELRRTLEKAGYTKLGLRFSGNTSTDESIWNRAIDAVCDACVELSATSTGALIVIERQSWGNRLITERFWRQFPARSCLATSFTIRHRCMMVQLSCGTARFWRRPAFCLSPRRKN